jgi:hypothetical protein
MKGVSLGTPFLFFKDMISENQLLLNN